MNTIKWCVIGAGGIADRRGIPALLLDPRNEITAVMDQKLDIARKVAEKYGFAQYFDDPEEMLKNAECDIVYIATPVFCHYEQAMLALRYGKHVIIEKPLAMNSQEAETLVKAFQAAGKQITIGYMMGYHNLHEKARQIIADGGIGDLQHARFQFSCWYPDIPGAWRQTKALGGGGCIADLGVHCMELFNSITGDDIAQCQAFMATRTFRYEVEDSAVIMFRSEKGVLGHIDVNFNLPDTSTQSKVELYGTEGSILAIGTMGQTESGTMQYIYTPQSNYEAGQTRVDPVPEIFTGAEGNIYCKQFSAVADLIASGKTCYENAMQALKIQKLCDSIYAQ